MDQLFLNLGATHQLGQQDILQLVEPEPHLSRPSVRAFQPRFAASCLLGTHKHFYVGDLLLEFLRGWLHWRTLIDGHFGPPCQ